MRTLYVHDFIWGLCVIVSWAGWGTLLRKVLRISDRRSTDWGLRAGWGASLAIAIGGVLNLCHVSTQPVVVAVVLIGLLNSVVELYSWFRRRLPAYHLWLFSLQVPGNGLKRAGSRLVSAVLFIGPSVLALAFLYVGSVHQRYCLNPYDDYLAYLVFPLRILQTGTLIEPFGQRRLATFGGHAFLTAMVFSGSSADMACALEMGLCPIVIAALIYGFLRPRTPRQFLIAGLLIVVSFITAVPRANTQSLATGVMLFLTLFRTLALEMRAQADRKRIAWATVLVVAAVSTLRVNNLIAAFGALILSRIVLEADRPILRRLKDAAADSAKAGVFILPWSILLYISSGTFLFPLMKGNERGLHLLLRTDYGIIACLRWIGRFLWFGPVPFLLAPIGLVILLRPHCQCRSCRAALVVAAGGFVASVVTVAGCSPSITELKDIYRFTFPILFSMSLAALMAMMAIRSFASRAVPSYIAAPHAPWVHLFSRLPALLVEPQHRRFAATRAFRRDIFRSAGKLPQYARINSQGEVLPRDSELSESAELSAQ